MADRVTRSASLFVPSDVTRDRARLRHQF
jgi:hypothetical protein